MTPGARHSTHFGFFFLPGFPVMLDVFSSRPFSSRSPSDSWELWLTWRIFGEKEKETY
jgi:hypothetical protein